MPGTCSTTPVSQKRTDHRQTVCLKSWQLPRQSSQIRNGRWTSWRQKTSGSRRKKNLWCMKRHAELRLAASECFQFRIESKPPCWIRLSPSDPDLNWPNFVLDNTVPQASSNRKAIFSSYCTLNICPTIDAETVRDLTNDPLLIESSESAYSLDN